MTQINKIFFVAIMMMLVGNTAYSGPSLCEVSSLDAVMDELYEDLGNVEVHNVLSYESYTPNMYHIGFSGERNGIITIISLWKKGYNIPVELAWWRSEHRSIRLLVLGLFYGRYTDQDISILPEFEKNAQRFEFNEQKCRNEEIQYIKNHIIEVRDKISKYNKE